MKTDADVFALIDRWLQLESACHRGAGDRYDMLRAERQILETGPESPAGAAEQARLAIVVLERMGTDELAIGGLARGS